MISILNVHLFTLRAKSEFSNRSTMVEVLWIFNFSITEFSIRIGSFKPHKLISFYQDEPNVIRIFTDNSYLYQIKIWWFTIFDAVSALESYYIISNLILLELIKLKGEKEVANLNGTLATNHNTEYISSWTIVDKSMVENLITNAFEDIWSVSFTRAETKQQQRQWQRDNEAKSVNWKYNKTTKSPSQVANITWTVWMMWFPFRLRIIIIWYGDFFLFFPLGIHDWKLKVSSNSECARNGRARSNCNL